MRSDGYNRRKYDQDMRCEDCGRSPATTVYFWSSGMPYRVCKDHAREYRGIILKPCSSDCVHATA